MAKYNPTKGTPYLTLTDELWGVFWQDFGENWLRYNHTALYLDRIHYSDVIMSVMASQSTSRTIVYSNVYSGTDQRKHQSSASLAFVRGIHQWLVNSPHKAPVMQKMFPFHDVIMNIQKIALIWTAPNIIDEITASIYLGSVTSQRMV